MSTLLAVVEYDDEVLDDDAPARVLDEVLDVGCMTRCSLWEKCRSFFLRNIL